MHHVFEDSPPVLVIFKLIEAGAGGCEEDDVTLFRCRGRTPDSSFQGFGVDDLGGSGDLRLDFLCRRTDGVHALDALAQEIVQDRVIAALVFAAEDHVDVAGERFERLDGCIHIGGLGVIVEIYAVDGGHVLEAVLDGFEFLHGFADAVGLAADQRPYADGREDIFQIVRTLEANLTDGHDFHVISFGPPEDFAVTHEGALVHFFLAAEPEFLRFADRPQLHAGGVVRVENSEVAGSLVLKNPRLGRDVGLKRVVAVEVVGRDVQDYGYFSVEGINGFELEARDFEHDIGVVGGFGNERDRRCTDVAAHKRLVTAPGDDFTRESRRRGFAI